MQHGEINGPLNVKVVAASFEQRLNHLLNTAFFPEPLAVEAFVGKLEKRPAFVELTP
jgi:hypothetical protein